MCSAVEEGNMERYEMYLNLARETLFEIERRSTKLINEIIRTEGGGTL